MSTVIHHVETALAALDALRAGTNAPEARAELEIARGDLHVLSGDLASALRAFRGVLALHRMHPVPRAAGRAALAIGRIVIAAGERTRAEGPFRLALRCARAVGDRALEEAARRALGDAA